MGNSEPSRRKKARRLRSSGLSTVGSPVRLNASKRAAVSLAIPQRHDDVKGLAQQLFFRIPEHAFGGRVPGRGCTRWRRRR